MYLHKCIWKGYFSGEQFKNLIEFYPSIFTTGPYPEGNFSWHHLWFIAYLLIYSLVALPVLLWFRSESGQAVIHKTAQFSQKTGLYWLVIPTFLASLLWFWYPEETHAIIDDLATLVRYFVYFIAGCFIGTNTFFWKQIEDKRREYLKVAFFSTLAFNYLRWNDIEPDFAVTLPNLLCMVLWAIQSWACLLALFGYAKKYCNSDSRFLTYANEGIYPFYILHQTVIVIIAFYVVQTEETIISKYIFLTAVSFTITVALYEFLIRPYNPIRFLFGMKDKA